MNRLRRGQMAACAARQPGGIDTGHQSCFGHIARGRPLCEGDGCQRPVAPGVGGSTMNSPERACPRRFVAMTRGGMTRRALLVGAAGAAALGASSVMERSAMAQTTVGGGMARAAGAAASAEAEVKQRLAAAMGAAASASTNQGVSIAQGAAANAMANAHGVA